MASMRMPVELAAKIDEAVRHMGQQRFAEAEALLRPLHAQTAEHPFVAYNLGCICHNTARWDEAGEWYRRAIAVAPGFVPALLNLGHLLGLQDRSGEGVVHLRTAVRLEPRNPPLLRLLANQLIGLGRGEEALPLLERALALAPDDADCLQARVALLGLLGRKPEVKAAAMQALPRVAPAQRPSVLINLLDGAAATSDWALFEAQLPGLREAADAGACLPPMFAAFFLDDPLRLGRLARNLAQRQPPSPPRPARAWREGRMRVAYLSPDLRQHPVAQMLLGVLRRHDRRRVHLTGLSLLPPDGSALCRALLQEFDEHLDLSAADDAQAVQEIRRRGIDVLVDLAGGSRWNRPGILARRPAPAQVLWLGCPASTGMPGYDAILLDGVVAPPGSEQHFTEPVVRLPCCYHPIAAGDTLAERTRTRADYGLPEQAVVVGMLQQAGKIQPPFIDAVAQVLARHPEAVLWLRLHAEGAEAALARLARHGLPRQRVVIAPLFAERSDYLAAYLQADLLVDTHPYGGHSTTGEALIHGAPVVTFAGRSVHARVAASMLHELGLGDLVCDGQDGVLATLAALLASAELRRVWKERFAAAAAAYAPAGGQRLARHLEEAYEQCLRGAPEAPPAA